MDIDKIKQLSNIISKSKYMVFLGGAGVSTESDIPDFRSDKGIYSKKYPYPAEVMLSHTFFVSHTREFYDFYKNNMIYKNAKANQAHKALAELEEKGILKAIITQNIDGLHQQAGSKNVLELHGSIYRNYCSQCLSFYGIDYILESEDLPICQCGAVVKPDVVLYEEALNENILKASVLHLQKADTLIIGGTSLTVYPAASLVDFFMGSTIVIINKSPTPGEGHAQLVINDNIGAVLNNALANL